MSTLKKYAPWVIVGYGLLYYGWLHLLPEESYMRLIGGNALFLLGAASATLLTFLASRASVSNHKYFWLLLFIGNLYYVMAELLWNYYELILKVEVPFPGSIDFFYYMNTLFYLLALTYLFYVGKKSYAVGKYLFNSMIIMTVATTITYQYIIAPILLQKDVSLIYMISCVGYPIGDLALLFGGISLYMSSHYILPKKHMGLICLGLITQAIANLLYTYTMLTDYYISGSFFDPLWPMAILFIAVPGVVGSEDDQPGTANTGNGVDFPRQDKVRLFLPYISVIFLFLLLLVQQEEVGVLFTGFSLSIVLVIIRQVLTLLENQSLLEQLHILNRDLEKKVELRTQELAQMNNELVVANQYKDDIIASMSHELRTPIHVILSYIELIEEEEDEPISASTKADLDVIKRSTKRLLLIIDNLVYLSEVHNSSSLLKLERVCIKDTIYHIYEEFFYMSQEKGLDFILDIQGLHEDILFDQLKLQQILSNLVMNAIKFTQKGYIKIFASMEGDYLIISVEDTGIGIPQEYHSRIFEKFVQVDRGISRRYGGAGIGLTIVKNLVDLLDGSIHLESALHQGTKFVVQFPVQE